jgi:histidinol phosphatase-like enzyme
MANSITVDFVTISGKQYLQFKFSGHLDETTATKAIQEWKMKMSEVQSKGVKVDMIYDCSAMTGFETNARKNWQSMMMDYKSKIGVIWMVSDNIFILGAAKTMGVLTGFGIKITRTLGDIK